MPYCEVESGIRLYYEDFGDGPAVVFTASGSQTHRMWENQVAALAGEFRAVAYDWRGTGNSDKPRGGYTIERATADLCALIEGLGLAPAVLAAHGIGFGLSEMPTLAAMASGIVAEEQALRRPVTVVITPTEPGIEDVGTADGERSVKDRGHERPVRLAAVPAGA